MRRYVPQRRAIASVLLLLLAACGARGPEPIALGVDGCDFCRMTISDARFGGEAVTSKGRVHKFDSIECLAGWARTAPAGSVRALNVIDTQHPGTIVPADSAGFIKGGFMNSPMGRSIVGFASPKAAEEQRTMLGGTVLTWAGVLADAATPLREAR
jgi:copper chaperone NosL